MINSADIKPDMPVVCSRDGQFAVVEKLLSDSAVGALERLSKRDEDERTVGFRCSFRL